MSKLAALFSKGKRLTSDFVLRISSSLITTFANQIVLLPILAAVFDEAMYGMILTVVGIKNIISGTLGNSLYSTRLVMNSEYEGQGRHGDFNRMIALGSAISVVAMIVTAFAVGTLDTVTWLLLIPVTVLYTLNAYLTVWYPVKLEFKKSFVHSIVVSVGTLIGTGLVYVTKLWPLAYLCSALAGFVFLVCKTGVLKEPFTRTPLLQRTAGKWGVLIGATLLTNVVTYLDRLVLSPLMGPEAVATYTTASYFGKALSILAMPVASVLLGYYAQRNFKMTRKLFWITNAAYGAIFGVFLIASAIAGEWVTGLLFPTLVANAAPYIFIANASAALAAVIQLVQSVALKYAPTYWQILIQIGYLGLYFGLGVWWLTCYGLMGFCMAALLANVFRMAVLLVISHIALKPQTVSEDSHDTDEGKTES